MATIYGDYTAQAISGSSTQTWHILGEVETKASLCGKVIRGDLHMMMLHVSLLECSTCMKLGAEKFGL